MLKKGVYTSRCPKCGRSILIHLASDGSISPNKCSVCETEFEGIGKGGERNTFVIVVKTKESTIVVNQGAEEVNKTDKKKSSKTFSLTKKATKKS